MKPYEFRDSKAIITCLSQEKTRISKWFDHREDSLELIVKEAVAGNTFRAFRNMPEKPSAVFRNWASRALSDKRIITRLTHLRSQTAYDDWLRRFSTAFRRNWRKHMGIVLPYGPSTKLPNLLLKRFVLWSDLTDNQRGRLIEFLHVPLDKFTLVGMTHCIDDPQIPANATMNFVANETMYNQVQNAIRAVTTRAKVPAIYFDVLAWDMSRDVWVAEVKPVTREQIDALLPYLDKFEAAGFSAGKWNSEPGQFPWFTFDEVVMEFIQVLYDNEWVTPKVNWTKWQASARRYVESPELIDSADTATIQKLLTTHARTDRFCEGHLAAMFENGHVVAILRRLRDIREEMDG